MKARSLYGLLAGTLLVIVILPLVFGWSWSEAFYRGMLLLVAMLGAVAARRMRPRPTRPPGP